MKEANSLKVILERIKCSIPQTIQCSVSKKAEEDEERTMGQRNWSTKVKKGACLSGPTEEDKINFLSCTKDLKHSASSFGELTGSSSIKLTNAESCKRYRLKIKENPQAYEEFKKKRRESTQKYRALKKLEDKGVERRGEQSKEHQQKRGACVKSKEVRQKQETATAGRAKNRRMVQAVTKSKRKSKPPVSQTIQNLDPEKTQKDNNGTMESSLSNKMKEAWLSGSAEEDKINCLSTFSPKDRKSSTLSSMKLPMSSRMKLTNAERCRRYRMKIKENQQAYEEWKRKKNEYNKAYTTYRVLDFDPEKAEHRRQQNKRRQQKWRMNLKSKKEALQEQEISSPKVKKDAKIETKEQNFNNADRKLKNTMRQRKQLSDSELQQRKNAMKRRGYHCQTISSQVPVLQPQTNDGEQRIGLSCLLQALKSEFGIMEVPQVIDQPTSFQSTHSEKNNYVNLTEDVSPFYKIDIEDDVEVE